MARYVLVQSGRVVAVSVRNNARTLPGWIVSDTAQIGDLHENGAFRPAPLDRSKAASEIDDAAAAVTGRFTRFQLEYEQREEQAKAFKDGGYVGAAPVRVAEFATPAGLTSQQAADLILTQAAQLRGALDQIAALRMRKYEMQRAATDGAARQVRAEVLAGIAAIGADL